MQNIDFMSPLHYCGLMNDKIRKNEERKVISMRMDREIYLRIGEVFPELSTPQTIKFILNCVFDDDYMVDCIAGRIRHRIMKVGSNKGRPRKQPSHPDNNPLGAEEKTDKTNDQPFPWDTNVNTIEERVGENIDLSDS